MGLETGTGIGDLVPTNPLSTDAVSAGDDHIRLIKTVMQSITFLKSIQTFTVSGTWTRPANVKRILIYCLGAGGGGNGGKTSDYSGGGGSSGMIAMKWLDVSAIASATVAIGAGGTGGAIEGGLGANGGATVFSTPGPINQCVAQGGIQASTYEKGGINHALAAGIGDIIFSGSYGHFGLPFHATRITPGAQGGGAGGMSETAAMVNSGGGGGGGSAAPTFGLVGAAGGSGYCVVLEYGW